MNVVFVSFEGIHEIASLVEMRTPLNFGWSCLLDYRLAFFTKQFN